MAKHAVLGPSGSDRWMVCSGSVALSAGALNPSNNAADEGTCYHFLGALCLECFADANDYIDREIVVLADEWCGFVNDAPGEPSIRHSSVVEPDNAQYLQVYLDYVRTAAMSGTLYVEQAVPIEHLTQEEDAEGTADAIIINTEQAEIHVIDLKFGRGVEVDAERNPQMMMYALGAMEKYPGTYKTVRMTIVQPRSGDGKPKEWSCPASEVLEFGAKVKRAASSVWAAIDLYQQILDAGMPVDSEIFQSWADQYLLVGDKQCKFCRAKARCPRIAATVEGMTAVEFENPEQVELPVVVEELPNQHPNADLAAKMDKCDLIEGWIKAVRAEVERELIEGRDVPGYKLVKGKKGNRKWISEVRAIELLKKMRLKQEQMFNLSVKSPADIDKLLKKAAPKKWEKVLPLIVQAEGGLSVAPVSDPREAASVKPTADGMEAEEESFV